MGQTAPVLIGKGILGNDTDLLVSPNHRMLLSAQSADLYFGENGVLVAAKHLITNQGVKFRIGGTVTYFHLLFDRHQVVIANGAPSESFFPGDQAMNSLDVAAQQEVFNLFPELISHTARGLQHTARGLQHTARMCLNKREARVLHALIG